VSEIGIFLAGEEHGPNSLISQAQAAEAAGFRSVLISDHFHPWLDRQGESPFVWSVIGAIAATTRLRVTTGVTCPTVRIHPAIVAQAAATSQLMLGGRFVLGIGSGEALNEHILGDPWPEAKTRLDMLEEATAIMRQLWSGKLVNHQGRYFTVENARLYSCPETPPPVIISAFGPMAVKRAAVMGGGLITVRPDAAAVRGYCEAGGTGPIVGALKVCWHPDERKARRLAHELWPTDLLPGQLNQELRTPNQFEQAVTLVTEDMVAEQTPCGPDPERYLKAILSYRDAGFDEIYLNQIGTDQPGFFDFFNRELRHRLEL
jgi:G6PDH family F420-dependent oxidoreductase